MDKEYKNVGCSYCLRDRHRVYVTMAYNFCPMCGDKMSRVYEMVNKYDLELLLKHSGYPKGYGILDI